MSTTAGYFTETDLLAIRRRVEDFPNWDTNVKKQFQPFADSIKTIISTQTARFLDLEDPKKDRTVDVEFINACGLDDATCDPCTMGGSELSSNIATLSLDLCREVNFTVDENKLIGNDFDKEFVIAQGILKADKEIAEYLNGQAIATIEANLGVNAFTGGKGNVVGTETYLLPAYWDAKLMAYFERVRVLNKMKAPFILDGSNLFEQIYSAKVEPNMAENNMFGTLEYYSDLSGIDAANTPDLKTYLIDRGALAFASKIYYPTLVEYKDANRYSISSQLLPGVKYDVYYSNTCYGNFYKHNFKVVFHGGIFAAPLGCTATETGILSFTCGTGS